MGRLRRCSTVIIDLYGMFRVWTDTRNTAARNAVMFGLIEFYILHSPYWGKAALGVCNILHPLFSYLIQREKIFWELLRSFCSETLFSKCI